MRPERTEGTTTWVGQSEVVGLVLIFGITFLSIGVILVTGIPSLNQAEELAQVERIQTEFTSLDQVIRESVYTPGQSGASVSLSEGGVSVDDGSTMAVNVTHRPSDGSLSSTTTGWKELGGLLYETGGSGVAYQMGGVWYTDDTGFSMKSPPSISYRGSSLKMDMVNFTENVSVAGSGSTDFLVRSEGTENLDSIRDSLSVNGTLDISVRTEYDEAWTEYFSRTFGEDNVDGSGGYANASLRTGPPLFGVEYLEDRFRNSTLPITDQKATVYDSRIGNRSEYNYAVDVGKPTPPPAPTPLSLPVTSSDISACAVSGSGQPSITFPTITSGDYADNEDLDNSPTNFDTNAGPIRYFYTDNSLTLDQDVNFDTSGGPVEIHVTAGDVDIDASTISVNGSNPVRLYADADVEIDSATDINLEGGRTELFQIYSTGDVDVNSNYSGTIYAPDAEIEIDSGKTFRGAAIANGGSPVSVEVDGEYFHDAALRQADIPDCINPPLSRFSGVEHKILMR